MFLIQFLPNYVKYITDIEIEVDIDGTDKMKCISNVWKEKNENKSWMTKHLNEYKISTLKVFFI